MSLNCRTLSETFLCDNELEDKLEQCLRDNQQKN